MDTEVSQEKAERAMLIISDSGSIMMTIEGISREGDRLAIVGSMIGAWPSTMYVDLEGILNGIRFIFSPQILFYILSLPFLVLKRRWRQRKQRKLQGD